MSVCLSSLTGMNLVSHPADGVGNGLEDDNSPKPAMDQVHGVERDTSELDDRVVAASQEEERNHVHDGHDTRSGEECASAGREAAVVDLPDAESDVDGEVADKEEGLETARQSTHAEGRGELELAVMTGAQKRRIEAGFLESGVEVIGDGEVALCVVVEA